MLSLKIPPPPVLNESESCACLAGVVGRASIASYAQSAVLPRMEEPTGQSLREASARGHAAEVRRLLQEGTPVDAADGKLLDEQLCAWRPKLN